MVGDEPERSRIVRLSVTDRVDGDAEERRRRRRKETRQFEARVEEERGRKSDEPSSLRSSKNEIHLSTNDTISRIAHESDSSEGIPGLPLKNDVEG